LDHRILLSHSHIAATATAATVAATAIISIAGIRRRRSLGGSGSQGKRDSVPERGNHLVQLGCIDVRVQIFDVNGICKWLEPFGVGGEERVADEPFVSLNTREQIRIIIFRASVFPSELASVIMIAREVTARWLTGGGLHLTGK
jgi:hypothetical protein